MAWKQLVADDLAEVYKYYSVGASHEEVQEKTNVGNTRQVKNYFEKFIGHPELESNRNKQYFQAINMLIDEGYIKYNDHYNPKEEKTNIYPIIANEEELDEVVKDDVDTIYEEIEGKIESLMNSISKFVDIQLEKKTSEVLEKNEELKNTITELEKKVESQKKTLEQIAKEGKTSNFVASLRKRFEGK